MESSNIKVNEASSVNTYVDKSLHVLSNDDDDSPFVLPMNYEISVLNDTTSHESAASHNLSVPYETPSTSSDRQTVRVSKDHPLSNVIGDPLDGVRTRSQLQCEFACYVS